MRSKTYKSACFGLGKVSAGYNCLSYCGLDVFRVYPLFKKPYKFTLAELLKNSSQLRLEQNDNRHNTNFKGAAQKIIYYLKMQYA